MITGFKKLLLIFVCAMLCCAGPALAAKEAADKSAEKTAEGGEGKDGKAAANSDSSFYIRMDPMILPIIGDTGLQEVVSLLVALEVKDQRTVEKVNGLTPKLKDAYMRALYGRLDKSAYRNGKFLDVDKIKLQLASVTDTLLGKGMVESVLIQGINQRHFN